MTVPISNVERKTSSLPSISEVHPGAHLPSSVAENYTHNTNGGILLSTSPLQIHGSITQEPAASTTSADETAFKRERKRKTGRTRVDNHTSESERMEQIQHQEDSLSLSVGRGPSSVSIPAPSPLLPKSDYIPRTSSPLASPLTPRSTFFSSKRQNSMPVSPSSPKPVHGRFDSSAPSPLAPSFPSPGSSFRRSWRSLSLSLASSAKSFGLKTPGILDQNQQNRHHVTEFGHEYDYNDFGDPNANNHSSLITLPPSITTSMSLLRQSPTSALKNLTREQEILRQFIVDFQSRFWFTYRKDLARIEPSFYTCDSGWGCMMRTGQSLLAQAFAQVLLGREWRAHLPQTPHTERRYSEILSWFVDDPEFPYSIHRIAKAGLALDKRIGEWFGPSTVAHAFQRLSQRHDDCPLSIMVPMDGIVRISSIVQAATRIQSQSEGPSSLMPALDAKAMAAWKPVLLLIPSRFGLDKLTD
ncbi:Cysteine protease atg4c, partial [Modicella reniformis]